MDEGAYQFDFNLGRLSGRQAILDLRLHFFISAVPLSMPLL